MKHNMTENGKDTTVSHTDKLLAGLVNGLAADTHLLGIETSQPGILTDLISDKGNGHLTSDLNGRLTFLPTVEPALRPATIALGIEIDRGHTTDIIAVEVNLQTRQRVNSQTIG